MKQIGIEFTKENRALVRAGLKTETRREMTVAEQRKAAEAWGWGHMKLWQSTKYGYPQGENILYWVKEPVRLVSLNEGVEDSPLPWVELMYLDDVAPGLRVG